MWAGRARISAPSIGSGANGLPTVAVQGPSNSLWLYWQTPDAEWHGPAGVGGPGSDFSAPSIAFGANGLPTVAVQGPSNSLWLYWQTPDAEWHGPAGVGGPGSDFSAPSVGSARSLRRAVGRKKLSPPSPDPLRGQW